MSPRPPIRTGNATRSRSAYEQLRPNSNNNNNNNNNNDNNNNNNNNNDIFICTAKFDKVFKYALLALINRAGGLYERILTEVAGTDRA